MASREQWGQCALQMKELLRLLLKLTCHVVIIAQEREFNNDDEGDLLMPFVASALSPSVVGWLNPACDYIGQMFIRRRFIIKESKVKTKKGVKIIKTQVPTKGVDYCMRVGPDAVFTTKFRLPKGSILPEVLVDPSFGVIDKLIRQGG